MKVVTPVFAMLWMTLSSALPLEAEVRVEGNGGEEGVVSLDHRQGNSRPGVAPLRVEEPDGTLRPLPSGSIPEGRLRMEDLRGVPDTGGGTMVNIEGRFQSVLRVLDGADQAIHQHDPEDRQPFNP